MTSRSGRNLGLRAILFMFLAYAGMILVLFALAESLRPNLIDATAHATAALLTVLDAGAHTEGPVVVSRYGSVLIIYECTGIFPIVIVMSAVLAFPCGWRWKLLGLSLGVSIMLVLNQVRILSLVYLTYLNAEMMERVHHIVWPTFIIFSTAVLFVIWARAAYHERHGR